MSIKDHFTSRYGKEGIIIEADAKQTEVVAAAFLSQDINLIQDLNNGVDIHRKLGAIFFNKLPEEITKEERTLVKNKFTFPLIYGAGVKRITEDSGLEESFVKECINKFFHEYSGLKFWQEGLIEQVEASSKLIDECTLKGFQKHSGYYRTITGRRLIFKTKDSPKFMQDKGIMTSFNPPDIKDYPVQSFATADVWLTYIGIVFRLFLGHEEEFLIVNTVHDSLIIDCKKKFFESCINSLNFGIVKLKDNFKDLFNIEFNVPIEIEIKCGNSWGNMLELDKYRDINYSEDIEGK